MSLHFYFSLTRKQFTLDVEIEPTASDVIVITGHSGAGKTSLLRCLAGLEKKTLGYCYFRGRCWQDSSHQYFLQAHHRFLAYVSQEIHLFPHLSVQQNLEFGYKRISIKNRIAQIDQVIAWFDIKHLLNHDIKNLSGGERQRIALAQAILKSPELLLMDEPFSAADKDSRAIIVNGIQNYQRLTNASIIYVTHIEDEIFFEPVRLILKRGKIEV